MIPWAAVEPLPGYYDWSAVDRVVNSASVRGIKVVGVLNSTPAVGGSGEHAAVRRDAQ